MKRCVTLVLIFALTASVTAKQAGNYTRSMQLTSKAEKLIKNEKFQEAFKTLEEAILLSPDNIKARKMYQSTHDVLKVEGSQESSGSPGKVNLEFLSKGSGLLGRKVRILTNAGFKFVGFVVKDNSSSISVYSESTNRSYEIDKADIVYRKQG